MWTSIARPVLLAAAFLTLSIPAAAQSYRGVDAGVDDVRSHADWLADSDSTWSLAIGSDSGPALRYLGAAHSDDPSNPQFPAIAAAWEEVRPTRAFFEGPDRGIADTVEETIERFGESGYVRYLAARDSVPVATLEPSPFDEAAYLRERFPDEQVALFYLLREASRLRERKGMDGPAIEAAVGDLLARAREMGLLRGEVETIETLDRAYRRYWSEPAEWWKAPAAWFDPLKSSEETAGSSPTRSTAPPAAFGTSTWPGCWSRRWRRGSG